MRFKRVTSFDDWPTDNPEKMKEMLRKPHLAFMPYVGGPSAKDDDIVMLSPRSTKTGPVTIVEYDVDDLGSIVYVNDYAVQAAAIFFRAGRNIINADNHDAMGKTFFDFHYGDDGLMMIADGELSEGQTHQLMLIDPDEWEFSKMWEDTQYEPITAHGNQDLRKILDDFEKTGSVPVVRQQLDLQPSINETLAGYYSGRIERGGAGVGREIGGNDAGFIG